MSLIQALENEFTPEMRARGQDFYLSRRVRLRVTKPAMLMAEIEDSEVNRIYITPDGYDEFGAYCTCSQFRQHESCQHVWATFLEADARRFPWLKANGRGFVVALEPSEIGEAEEPLIGPEPSLASWRLQLSRVRTMMQESALPPRAVEGVEVVYVLDIDQAVEAGTPVLKLCRRKRKTNGEWGALKPFRVAPAELAQLPEAMDRQIIGALHGSRPEGQRDRYSYFGVADDSADSYRLESGNAGLLLPLLCRTERFFLRRGGDLDEKALAWDPGPAWVLGLAVATGEHGKTEVRGFLERDGGERMDLSEPDLLLIYGQVFVHGQIARFDTRGAFAWVNLLREQERIEASPEETETVIQSILDLPCQPLLDLPDPWTFVAAPPLRALLVAQPDPRSGSLRRRIACRLRFDYQGTTVEARDPRQILRRPETTELFERNPKAEGLALTRLLELGARPTPPEDRSCSAYLASTRFPQVIRELLQEGWKVEAEGKVYRPPGTFHMSVSAGVDWFDLHAQADFDGQEVPLPALLEAARLGRNTVELGDGTVGLLPEEWLRRCGFLAALGEEEDQAVRFRRSQTFLLDALLLAEGPMVDLDAGFARFRNQLRDQQGIEPLHEPPTFKGRLREYQRQALGWFAFLREAGFGGCLADDMGLGKTVQVLALLEERRASGAAKQPSLVVVPRSLVFNWVREAARFAPQLRTLDYTGTRRKELAAKIRQSDLVVTTYGVLRRDILKLRKQTFDYAVLDEAQAIKNPQSQSAKAARLLEARHRLALSGTPIENHLGELWSLFEFLNPGMLGRSTAFRDLAAESQKDDGERDLLARAIYPFILRRTKEEVAGDLPKKVEQTLLCDMKSKQSQLYDEMRSHFRVSLQQRIASEGFAKARMHVLEALLRLRQVACHPGLLDPEHTKEPSAKLEVLIPKLLEVCDQGHKALVFSQFTRLLAILREHLDAEGLRYEYLDGQTTDRQERVANFQSDDGPPVFLISLKAGGLGLNLTAADYVFILDPWWNPAIEAQAIDRAHRIGQTRRVFAYRLICGETVEEKIVELQQRKKDLADAIIRSDGTVLKNLAPEDLEILLS